MRILVPNMSENTFGQNKSNWTKMNLTNEANHAIR